MAYKSRKKLRKKCFGGEAAAAAIIAGVNSAVGAANVAAQAAAAKQQADAMRENARQQAQAQVQSSTLQANALKQQSDNDKQMMQTQIDTQKQLNESQNDIFKDMNMNMALLAGQQNVDERKEEAKIKVKYGSSKLGDRKLRNKRFVSQDNNYLIPVDNDGAFLLRGGSPSNPEDQTHDNSHKNTKRSSRNKGSFIKFNGREIEAEAGGMNTLGEIVDFKNNVIYSQRPLFIDGTSPVERILAGEPKEQVAIEQEMAKQYLGINDEGNRAKYGFRTRLSTSQERQFMKWWNKNAPVGSNPDDYVTDYRRAFKNSNAKYNRYSMKCGGRVKAKTGKFSEFMKSDAGIASTIGAGSNLLGAGLNFLGNNISKNTLNRAQTDAANMLNKAYGEREKIYTDAYNRMTGINVDDIFKDGAFDPALAIASVRTGRFNINPQLVQNERTYHNEQNAAKNIGSAAARNALLAQAGVRRTDNDMKMYAEQANRVEQINQANIQELNKMANENADRRMKAMTDKSAVRLDALKYNNDINNFKIQGIADAQSDRIMSSSETNANTRLANADRRGRLAQSTFSDFANVFNNGANTLMSNYNQERNRENAFTIGLVSSTNPNGAANLVVINPDGHTLSEAMQAWSITDNPTLKAQLEKIIRNKGGQVPV